MFEADAGIATWAVLPAAAIGDWRGALELAPGAAEAAAGNAHAAAQATRAEKRRTVLPNVVFKVPAFVFVSGLDVAAVEDGISRDLTVA
jgi:pyruvate/2-oxoglutarate dehydrogenase complex dihydrolipoamide dehydrogenase (E3) component